MNKPISRTERNYCQICVSYVNCYCLVASRMFLSCRNSLWCLWLGFRKAESPAHALLFPQLPSGAALYSCESEQNGGTKNCCFPVLPQLRSCSPRAAVLSERQKTVCSSPVKKLGLVLCFPTVLCL